jgi:hypothetical protein
MAGEAKHDVEHVIEHIRELHEQALEVGREAGLDFLKAYEQTLNTFADYQDKLADSAQVEAFTRVLRAQADFARQVLGAYSQVAREAFKG